MRIKGLFGLGYDRSEKGYESGWGHSGHWVAGDMGPIPTAVLGPDSLHRAAREGRGVLGPEAEAQQSGREI